MEHLTKEIYAQADKRALKHYHEILKSDDEILKSAFDMLCDDMIGFGDHRIVFQSGMNQNEIVKIEHANVGANNIEFHIWHSVKGTPNERWFAPVKSLSGDGKILVMAKTKPVVRWPDKVPNCFNDMHSKNYGIYKGNFVCHDYGSFPLIMNNAFRLKNAKWRIY